MHASPAKHSYASLPRKCDYRTNIQTDAGQSDPYVPLCFAGDTKMTELSNGPLTNARQLGAFKTFEKHRAVSKLWTLQNRCQRLDNVWKAPSFQNLWTPEAFKISSGRRFQRFRKQSLSKVRMISFQKVFNSSESSWEGIGISCSASRIRHKCPMLKDAKWKVPQSQHTRARTSNSFPLVGAVGLTINYSIYCYQHSVCKDSSSSRGSWEEVEHHQYEYVCVCVWKTMPPLAKASVSYILTPAQPQEHVISPRCEQPLMNVLVYVLLLYHQQTFKYRILFVDEKDKRMNGRTNLLYM